MKKILSCLLSTIIILNCAIIASINVSAENITVEPDYPLYGNICGNVNVEPSIDRNVKVIIKQLTQEGEYIIYDKVLLYNAEEPENNYVFKLEGNKDALYEISVCVPIFKGSDNFNSYHYNFNVDDTDYITDETIDSYVFNFKVTRNDELDKPLLVSESEMIKNEDNVVHKSIELAFPTPETIRGDISNNGSIDLYDAIEIAKSLVGSRSFTEVERNIADYNGDGNVDLYDAIGIAKYLIGS